MPRRTPTYSSTSLQVSAIEWVVSASIAADPVSAAATATTTVRTLASSLWVTAPLDTPAAASRPG
jgi:hypothetical protein